MIMIDENERLSNSMCSSQRHCRWRCCFSANSANSTHSEKKRCSSSIRHVMLLLVTFVLQWPLIFVHAHFTSIIENRNLQVDNPSIEPISSNQPTLSLIPSRSFQPSLAPSFSQEPSISPSRRVTSAPSLRPRTASPTSALPTVLPTETESLNPTPIPTSIPTPTPQTGDPTLFPTLSTTTIVPTNQASAKPSITVTQVPIASGVPSKFPTTSPTFSTPTLLAIVAPPTGVPIFVFKYKKITLRVRDVTLMLFRSTRRFLQSNQNYELDENCTLTWQGTVQDRIKNELVSTIQDYEALDVELQDSSSSSNETAWSLTFDVFMEIRAASIENLDPIPILHGAFDSQSDKLSFIQFLKSTHCDEFDNIHHVSLHVPTEISEQTPSKNASQLAAIYASLSVGLAAIVMTAVTICCYIHLRNKRRVNDLASADNLIQPTRKSNFRGSGFVDAPSIIGGKSKNSDVSTLGDPIPFGVIREQHDDLSSANESCSLEYDFKKAFLDLNSITDSQICGTVDDQVSTTEMTLNDDVVTTVGLQPQHLKLMIALADDIVTTAGDGTLYSSHDGTRSMEEEYEVIVPPGLLGLILESQVGSGRPTVNSIKPGTVLSSVVQVGDYLEAVDGINVKLMSANDVSKLIVQMQEEVRILEFARPIKRKTYHL